MQNEISKAAEKLGISEEEAQLKFDEIRAENGGLAADNPVAIAMWRSYAAQVIRSRKSTNNTSNNNGGGGLAKQAFGFFISLEQPRDLNEYSRRMAVEEWKEDPFNAHKNGFVAIVEEAENGFYSVSRYHNDEVQTKTVKKLPDCVQELEDGSVIIPLDNTPRYQNGGENANYGKPLNSVMRRSGVFIGKVHDDEEYQLYKFSYKNKGVDFQPETFQWLSMVVIKDSNREGYIYGFTDKTIGSLRMNSEQDPEGDLYRDTSALNKHNLIASAAPNHVVYLGNLQEAHSNMMDSPVAERFVITNGTVCNINMTPTANGNRIINITDLTAEFDYEEEGMVTCWIPEGIEIDFGIGSTVTVVGRTSQRETDEGLQPVTINVSGMFVKERRGQVVEIEQATEEDLDWF